MGVGRIDLCRSHGVRCDPGIWDWPESRESGPQFCVGYMAGALYVSGCNDAVPNVDTPAQASHRLGRLEACGVRSQRSPDAPIVLRNAVLLLPAFPPQDDRTIRAARDQTATRADPDRVDPAYVS